MELERIKVVSSAEEDEAERVGMLSEKQPEDKYHAVYFIILLHGMGALMPWNMFITIAPAYYVNYKFVEVNVDGVEHKTVYALRFLSYLGLASQLPNLLLNVINLFIKIKGGLGRRIGFSLIVLAITILITLIFTVIDTSNMIPAFFFITMITVVIQNAINGVYQNSLFGLTASLPPQYTNALVLGNNLCGTFVSVVSIITILIAKNTKIAALLYFLISLFTIFACFGSIFLLQKLEFYKYYIKKSKEHDDKKQIRNGEQLEKIGAVDGIVTDEVRMDKVSRDIGSKDGAVLEPLESSFRTKLRLYIEVFKKIWIQCFNIWCVFFVTLTLFPAIMADIKYYSESGKYDFFIPERLFTSFTTYLLFNFFAAVGSFAANFVQWPSPKWLVVPVLARIALIPLLMFCYFRPEYRTWNVWIHDVWVYIALAFIMSITSGYFSSVGMMYAPRMVEPSKSPAAGMIAAFFLVFGITSGIVFTFFVSWFIDNAGPYPAGTFNVMVS